MDQNPYESPRTGQNDQTATSLPLLSLWLKAGLLSVAILWLAGASGVVGIVVGFMFCMYLGQPFWIAERPMDFPSAMGIGVILMSGLGFAISAGAASVVCVGKRPI